MEFHPLLENGVVPSDAIWYVLSSTNESPDIRVGHTCVPVGMGADTDGFIYVIGGANPSGTFSDMYVLNLDTFAWSKRDCSGFAGRYEHSAFVASCDPMSIYVFGGADGDGNRNDIQVYNTVENSWCTVKTSGTPPQPRTFHNGVCIESQFIVYGGGERGSEPVTDRKVHIFDAKNRSWSVLDVRGDAPKARQGHVMAAIDNRLYIHGGMAGQNFFDDLHALDLVKKSWFHVKTKSSRPPARAGHGSFVIGSDLFIFGGMNQNGALDDMYRFNARSVEWVKVELKGPPPANRLDFACCTARLRIPDVNRTNSCDESAPGASAEAVQSNLTIVSSNELTHQDQKSANIIDLNFESHVAGEGGIEESISSTDVEAECSSELSHAGESVQPVQEPLRTDTLIDEMTTCCLQDSREQQHASVLAEASHSSTNITVELAVVLGGMDTGGEIFDDCMVLRLS